MFPLTTGGTGWGAGGGGRTWASLARRAALAPVPAAGPVQTVTSIRSYLQGSQILTGSACAGPGALAFAVNKSLICKSLVTFSI